ncbi:dihydrodipicolinate synthase family protein [Capnocytophaga canimorsus]|uniref:dihydrodipicolinate synthase family protein n=1 Tax=Capnocytophaga canimorsus TaxID=28188 RepID=UPI001EDF7F3F|nr:dihydrodipicolinate synthase family protein [Capnocytophaga canimorsus]GJQ03867.1 N-acetylneuraminate lyase [Capnocytophaga canimorsus]
MKNLIAATYAPMHPNGAIAPEVIGQYANFLKKNKVSGIFANGSTGDFASLSVAERKVLIEAWAAEKSADFFITNHVGDINLNHAVELAGHCADKVDAISVLAPFYFKPNLDKLVDYCKAVAQAAPNIPFYYYHIPELTGAQLDMPTFMKKAKAQIPTFAGLKFTQNNMIHYALSKSFDNEGFNILFGVDEAFLASLPLGAKGWVGSTYNHLAPLYLAIQDAFHQGDYTKATELQVKAIEFVNIVASYGGFNGGGKSFMKLLGVDCGPARYPHVTLTDSQLNEIFQKLKNLGLTEYFSKK